MIKSDASPDEQSSPFYIANQHFCESVEKFIRINNGKSKGTFNAWAYLIQGTIKKELNWFIKYRKATLTGSKGSSNSKDQLLIVVAEWTCNYPALKGEQFSIVPTSFWNSIKMLLINSNKKLKGHENYIIKNSGQKSDVLIDVLKTLKPLLESGKILSIIHNKYELKIMIRTENQHFEYLSTLIEKIHPSHH